MRFTHILAIIALGGLAAVAACENDEDCKDTDGDEDCGNDGDETPMGNPIGGACQVLADCVQGAVECNDDPGGQCTLPCTTTADCAAFAGAVCEPGGGNCYHGCSSAADCTRPGYGCVGGEPGYKFCDPLHEVGDSCTDAADCAGELDICNDDPGGQCTKDCTTPADCAGVPGAICETERPGHCYAECTSKADCPRDGYDCVGGPNPEGKMWCDVL